MKFTGIKLYTINSGDEAPGVQQWVNPDTGEEVGQKYKYAD